MGLYRGYIGDISISIYICFLWSLREVCIDTLKYACRCMGFENLLDPGKCKTPAFK